MTYLSLCQTCLVGSQRNPDGVGSLETGWAGRKVEGEDLGDHLEMRAKRERGHSRWSAPELGDETRDWVCRRGER